MQLGPVEPSRNRLLGSSIQVVREDVTLGNPTGWQRFRGALHLGNPAGGRRFLSCSSFGRVVFSAKHGNYPFPWVRFLILIKFEKLRPYDLSACPLKAETSSKGFTSKSSLYVLYLRVKYIR